MSSANIKDFFSKSTPLLLYKQNDSTIQKVGKYPIITSDEENAQFISNCTATLKTKWVFHFEFGPQFAHERENPSILKAFI